MDESYEPGGLPPEPSPTPEELSPPQPTLPVPYAPRRRRRAGLGMVALALVAAIIGGMVTAYFMPLIAPAYAARVVPPKLSVVQTAASKDSPAVAAARRLSPAIVLVINQSVGQGAFGQQQQQEASGSGIIFDPRGYIVTNDHVVYGAQKLTVVLSDGTQLAAHVVGEDAPTDLAVIKVDAGKPLPTATFADSSKLVPGEMAIAVGNPLGLQLTNSVTVGVVSGLRAEPYGFTPPGSTGAPNQRVTEVIQTDASINPGNSGGALANVQGQVIGITAYKAVQAEPGVPASGIGFAIPSNTVQRVVNDLVKYGHVRRGYLGVVLETPSNAAPWQAVKVKISQIEPNGAAAKAGLQVGDVIAAINGKKVTNIDEAIADIELYRPGDVLTLTIQRGSRTLTVRATLENKPPAA